VAEAATAMKITAEDVWRFGIADQIVPEPSGGAHADPVGASSSLGEAFRATLTELDRSYGCGEALDADRLLRDRFAKYRRIGVFNAFRPRRSLDNRAAPRPCTRPERPVPTLGSSRATCCMESSSKCVYHSISFLRVRPP
jgi:hypothetical protein